MKVIECRWDSLGTSSRLTVCGRLIGLVRVDDDGRFLALTANDYTKYLEELPDDFDSREHAKRAVEQALGVREVEA